MRMYLIPAILVGLSLSARGQQAPAPAPTAAATTAAAPVSGTVAGRLLVKISSNGEMPRFASADYLAERMHALGGKLAPQVLGLPLEAMPTPARAVPGEFGGGGGAFGPGGPGGWPGGVPWAGSSPEPVRSATQPAFLQCVEFEPSTLLLACNINYPQTGVRPAVREFLGELKAAIPDLVKEAYQHQLKDAVARSLEFQQRLRVCEETVGRLRDQLKQKTGWAEVSSERIKTDRAKLDDEKLSLELKRVSKEARRQALQVAVERLSDQAGEQFKKDEIARELLELVKLRDAALTRVKEMNGKGQASVAEVNDAMAALSEAKVRLLERQRDLSAAAGGDALVAWNRELLTLGVDVQELKTLDDFLAKRLQALRDAAELMDRLRRAEAEADKVRPEATKAAVLAELSQRTLDSGRFPSVSVVEEKYVSIPTGH